jgi:hypothetical protein
MAERIPASNSPYDDQGTPSSAAAGARASAQAAVFARDSVYSNRPKRPRITRPLRKLRRHYRHTPTKSFVVSGVALVIAVIGLAVVFSVFA